MQRLQTLNLKRLLKFFVFGFFLFSLVGGWSIVGGYVNGGSFLDEARVAVPVPFVLGFYFFGFFGLVLAVRNQQGGLMGWCGLFMIVISYVGIEVFYSLIGGK